MERAQRLLARGARVADLGCWPGGWLQVAAEAVGPSGRVVGVDLAALDPPLDLANVLAFQGDFAEAPVLEAMLERLGGPADVLLSDAAPKLTGVRATDRAREEALLAAIEAALPRLLAPGGALLVKLLDCPESAGFARRIRARFASARELRPEASRKGSSERYLVAKGYRTSGRRD
jgi:23S rRNA (uridine2552-2'-O)-methyltransferase